MVVQVENLEFEFIADSVDSQIGDVSLWEINTVLKFFDEFIVATIALFFYQGFPLGWLLEMVHLDFLNFEDSLMKAFDSYYIFFFSPKFNISKLSNKVLTSL